MSVDRSEMNLENLANEILLDIFDYLRPSDFFQSFSLLNERFERLIRLKTNVHLDLSTNLSFSDFQRVSLLVAQRYSTTISSIRLSNIKTCGNIRLFLQQFPQLVSIDVDQPNENQLKDIFTSNHFQRISLKFHRLNEEKLPIGIVFNSPQLETYGNELMMFYIRCFSFRY